MKKKPFQGLVNILRFNWHQFLIALAISVTLLLLPTAWLNLAGILGMLSIFISLLVSYWVYDISNLYTLSFLQDLHFTKHSEVLNIHAGFDETSAILKANYPQINLTIADFYNSKKHSEISIKRARKMYPSAPNTIQVETTNLPFEKEQFDAVIIFFAAHEIRDIAERKTFFNEVHDVLTENGSIIVTEHLRNSWNALAYNIGSLHFYSKKNWQDVFKASNLQITSVKKTTPFVTTFVLKKRGTTS